MKGFTIPAPKKRGVSIFGRKAGILPGRRAVSSGRTERLAEAFRKVHAVLPGIKRDISSRYSLCTELLDPLAAASEQLVNESESLLRLAVGQTDGELITEGTADLLQPPMQYLDGWRSGVVAGIAELESCGNVLARLQGSESLLQAIVSPLHYMQVMFRVESARLSEDVRQIFASLTEQIAVVHGEVRTTFGQQFQIVSSTLRTLEGITAALRGQAQSLQSDLATRKTRISNSLEALRGELEKNAVRDVELSSTSRAAAQAIGEMIVALQSHDITTQRLDHILAAIEEAHGFLQDSSNDDAARKAFLLLAVQRAQIDGVYRDLRRSEECLVAAVQNIQDRVNSLDNGCMLLSEFKEITVGINGSIQVSIDMVVDLRNLLEAVVKCSREFHESIQPVGHLTTKLTGTLDQLSNKMRLIALNAQVQAVQIGAGTGLEVLAAHIAEVSAQTSALAEVISADIHLLVSTIRSLSQSFLSNRETGEEHLQVLRTTGGEHEARLHDIRDRTLEKLSLVGTVGETIKKLTGQVQAENRARATLVQSLKAAADNLESDLVFLKGTFEGGTFEKTADLGSVRYSMVSEHEAHSAALRQLNSSLADEPWKPEPQADSTTAAADTAESQVELF